jgi:hypothetical protein
MKMPPPAGGVGATGSVSIADVIWTTEAEGGAVDWALNFASTWRIAVSSANYSRAMSFSGNGGRKLLSSPLKEFRARS